MVSVDFINSISKTLFSDYLDVLVYSAKALAAIIFIVATSKKFMTEFAKKGELDPHSENGFNYYDLVKPLLTLVLIAAIPEILSLIDTVLGLVLDNFVTGFGDTVSSTNVLSVDVDTTTTDESSIAESTLNTLLDIKKYLSPARLITTVIAYIGYFVDAIIFLVYLGKRFFILAVVKIMSPLLVAFSIFPEFKSLVANTIKVYIKTFLTIFPMLLVVVFANLFYQNFIDTMSDTAYDKASMLQYGETIKSCAIFGLIILKIVLFKQCSRIINAIWP